MPIKAYETLDCASKVRVHYLLRNAVDDGFLNALKNVQVTINRFSQSVAGAHDHFSATGDQLRATGVLGQPKIVVTYGKLVADERPQAAIDTFETQLRQLTGDDIAYFKQRAEVV